MDVLKEKLEAQIEKIKGEGSSLEREMRARTVGYIVAALGLVVGLAWNDAVKSFIEYFFPLSENTLFAKLIYAFIITLVAVVVSGYLLRLGGVSDEKK